MLLSNRRNPKKKIKTNDILIENKDLAKDLAMAKMEKEQLKRDNIAAAKSLELKRKSLGLDYKACEKIEKEHFSKVEKLQDKKLKLLLEVEDKKTELENLNISITSAFNLKNELVKSIPSLEDKKLKLENEIKETTEEYNRNKSNSEIYLSNIRNQIDIYHKELAILDSKLLSARKELKDLLEKTDLENKILHKRHKDLEIYEMRIRSKNPNIIL
jgi:hypothetical protein